MKGITPKLQRVGDFWCSKGVGWFCRWELTRLFWIPPQTEYIWLRWSSSRMKESVKVQVAKTRYDWHYGFAAGEVYRELLTPVDHILNEAFPNSRKVHTLYIQLLYEEL